MRLPVRGAATVSRDVINIGDLTLVRLQIPKRVLFQELGKQAQLALEVVPYPLVPGIESSVSSLTPIVDEPVRLDLNKLTAGVTNKPDARKQRHFAHFETHCGAHKFLIENLNDWVKGRLRLDLREFSLESSPQGADMLDLH